jgi:hypothetical protein
MNGAGNGRLWDPLPGCIRSKVVRGDGRFCDATERSLTLKAHWSFRSTDYSLREPGGFLQLAPKVDKALAVDVTGWTLGAATAVAPII